MKVEVYVPGFQTEAEISVDEVVDKLFVDDVGEYHDKATGVAQFVLRLHQGLEALEPHLISLLPSHRTIIAGALRKRLEAIDTLNNLDAQDSIVSCQTTTK